MLALRLTKFADTVVDCLQSNCIGVPHWSSTICGETVPVHIHDVDVGSAEGVTFFQYSRPFKYEGVYGALDNFVGRNLATRNSSLFCRFFYQAMHFRIGKRLAFFLVSIPTRAGLLTVPAHGVQFLHDQ